MLLENVGEELDPLLEPLLMKQTFRQVSNFPLVPEIVMTVCHHQGVSQYIKLGENLIEYAEVTFHSKTTACLPDDKRVSIGFPILCYNSHEKSTVLTRSVSEGWS